MEIQLIKRDDIDKIKWNSCVHYATNGNIFGYKWYLDCVNKAWDGLVEGDYESVLPIFKTKKTNTLKQPALIREAGIYSVHVLSEKRILTFLETIPTAYQTVEIRINEGIASLENTDFDVSLRQNHQLLLMNPYREIRKHYSKALEIALKDSGQYQLKTANNVKPEQITDLYKKTHPVNRETETAFHAFHRIMYNALHRGWGFASGVVNPQNELLTAAFFVFSHGKAMLLLAPETSEGKAKGARSLLIDLFIRQNAGRPLAIDFNTENVYPLEFGAQKNTFQHLQKSSKKWWDVFTGGSDLNFRGWN